MAAGQRQVEVGVGVEEARAAGGTGVRGCGLGRSHAGGERELEGRRTVQRIAGFVCTPTSRAVWVQTEERRWGTGRRSHTASEGGIIGARAHVAGDKAARITTVADETRLPEGAVAHSVIVVTPSANAYFGARPLLQL